MPRALAAWRKARRKAALQRREGGPREALELERGGVKIPDGRKTIRPAPRLSCHLLSRPGDLGFAGGTGWVMEAPATVPELGLEPSWGPDVLSLPVGREAGTPHHQPAHRPSYSAFTRPVATSTTSRSVSPRLQLRLRPWQALEVGSEGATGGPANRCSVVRA